MSYEGYVQMLCCSGHLSTREDETWGSNVCEEECHVCGKGIVWRNYIDQTNCDDIGEIDMQVFLITEPVVETCNLGRAHMTSHAIYRIPSKEETQALRKGYSHE